RPIPLFLHLRIDFAIIFSEISGNKIDDSFENQKCLSACSITYFQLDNLASITFNLFKTKISLAGFDLTKSPFISIRFILSSACNALFISKFEKLKNTLILENETQLFTNKKDKI